MKKIKKTDGKVKNKQKKAKKYSRKLLLKIKEQVNNNF